MRKLKGVFLPVDGKPEVREYTEFSKIQEAVGGYVEQITDRTTVLLCDEESKFKNYKLNPMATALVQNNLRRGDYVAGDVVVVGPSDGENWADVSEELISLLIVE